MPIFFPPIHFSDARFHPNDVPYMKRLRARQMPSASSVNVWLLTDGTITLEQPADNADIKRWYQGGAYHRVSNAEADALEAAGYTLFDPTRDIPKFGPYGLGYAEGY